MDLLFEFLDIVPNSAGGMASSEQERAGMFQVDLNRQEQEMLPCLKLRLLTVDDLKGADEFC